MSVAYANKAVTLLWALLWSVLIFHEKLQWNHIAGVAIVIVGIVVLNLGQVEKEKEDAVND